MPTALEIVPIDEADQGQSRFVNFLLSVAGDGGRSIKQRAARKSLDAGQGTARQVA